jgi:hypothetical protein
MMQKYSYDKSAAKVFTEKYMFTGGLSQAVRAPHGTGATLRRMPTRPVASSDGPRPGPPGRTLRGGRSP